MTETEQDNEEEEIEEETQTKDDFLGLNRFSSKKVDLLKPTL
jgi:hypothetical protein